MAKEALGHSPTSKFGKSRGLPRQTGPLPPKPAVFKARGVAPKEPSFDSRKVSERSGGRLRKTSIRAESHY